ncbi:E3 ubiquitin-protein transferase RMND5B isoform X3 [Macaca fascicularis]|uniref:E3 ubiquitin-protein transferase RMND5B isoform X3 n=1 Tax=Macaca fascicularis TaxID=9541 RepID=UPI003D15568C
MEQCACVERELDKVLQKFLTYGQHCEQSLEELLHYVGQLRAELASAALQGTPLSATLSLVMSQCCRKIKDTVQKLASDHKDIHSSVSRVGKAIDRNFDSEICGVVSDAVWDAREQQQQILQMAIVEHLYQQGMLSVAEELCQESTLNVDLDFKQPFLELNRILEALHEQDLGPALEWAVSHRQRLLELNSSLEFKLHRLHFIRLLAGGPEKQLEALSYARHFQPFAQLHQRGRPKQGANHLSWRPALATWRSPAPAPISTKRKMKKTQLSTLPVMLEFPDLESESHLCLRVVTCTNLFF